MLAELPAMAWSVDASGGQAWFNRAFCRFAGWKDGEGQERAAILHADDRQAFSEEFRTAAAARDPLRLQARSLRSDGEYRWLLDTCVPWYDAAGAFRGYLGVCQDVTDLRQANEELKSFADAVSHDFRTPLATIRAYVRETERHLERLTCLFLEHADGLPGEMGAEALHLVQQQIPAAQSHIMASFGRLDSLLGGIVKLSRLGHRIPYAEPVATRQLVEELLASRSEQIARQGIRVAVGELPVMVVDRLSLEQILGDLLDNAFKFLDPERPGSVEVGAELRDLEVVFHVRDNGRGMSPEEVAVVFQLFRRVGKQDLPGEGMGLPFVKTLVRELGGRIWCVSSAGEGSTFSVALPFVPLHRSQDGDLHRMCELAHTCPFFNDEMGEMPATASRMKEKYCWGEKQECARYLVFTTLGGGTVPKGLSPAQIDEAKALIARRS
jgi:PAS domain S-box-containing protein